MSALDQLRSQLGNRYRIERELGRGGMGTVYLAHDVRLERPVALKVLPPEYAVDSSLRERFLRETRTAAGFSHPNIVPVYAVEERDDLLAYAMGFIEGESLSERVKRAGPLTAREAVKLLQDVGYALAYAHGRGVVHRDIKPDNVMIERATGRALVMDFGIARAITAPAANAGLTRVGEVVGTPEYMSPEQATGDHVDGRSDLYSLGLTAYFALTGTPAMAADSMGKVLVRQITETLPPMAGIRTDLPAPLAAAIDRCLAKDPAARFPNGEALVEALDVAQLAAPDIPLPIRLFAQEMGTLSLILIGSVIISPLMLRALSKGATGNIDAILPLVVLFGVVLTRVLQALTEARRLALGGFTPGDIRRGLAAVVAERERRRQDLRAEPRTRRARRRTIGMAIAQIVMAAILLRASLAFRAWHPESGGFYTTAAPGLVLAFSAMVMLGVGWVLLIRSPFRMPVGERLFRLVWLGPVGRGFVTFAGRGMATRNATSSTRGTAASARAVVRHADDGKSPPPAATADRFSALESRVEELERWRSRSIRE